MSRPASAPARLRDLLAALLAPLLALSGTLGSASARPIQEEVPTPALLPVALLPMALYPGPAIPRPEASLGAWPPRPDAEAPPGSGVTAPLPRDAFRVRYRLFHEEAEGLRRGSNGSSVAEVLAAGFDAAPVERNLDMHEFLVEYGLGTDLMVSLTLPFAGLELMQEDLDSDPDTSRSSGLGDVQLGGRLELNGSAAPTGEGADRWALGFALSLPTGSTNLSRDLGPGDDARLPYPLQLGSGTIDLRPELIWSRWTRRWSYGARASAIVRTSSNDNGYTLGDRAELTAWVARRIDRDHSLSIRVLASHQGSIDGADADLDPASSPAANPGSSGLSRIDAFLGVQYVGVAGHRFSAELGGPLLQHADGFQVDTDLVALLAWTYSF